MGYRKRKDADLTPTDTNVEPGTEQASAAVDLGGEQVDGAVSYSLAGTGTASASLQVQYAGNSGWVDEGQSSTELEGAFDLDGVYEQVRVVLGETGGGAGDDLTINSVALVAHYDHD